MQNFKILTAEKIAAQKSTSTGISEFTTSFS